MPRITVKAFSGETLKTHLFAAGPTFAQEAMRIWPNGFGPKPPAITNRRTGEEVTAEFAVNSPLKPGDEIEVVLNPAGPVAAFLALPFLGVTVGQVVLAAVSLALTYAYTAKLANIDGSSYEWEETENPQQLSGQTNQFRPAQRVPELFGITRHYPDQIAPAMVVANGSNWEVQELFAVTNGAAFLSDFKLDEEGLVEMPAGTWEAYGPEQTQTQWPEDFPILGTNNYVGEIEMVAQNELGLGGEIWNFRPDLGYVSTNFDHRQTFAVGDIFLQTLSTSVNRIPYEVLSIAADGKTMVVGPETTYELTSFPVIRTISYISGGAPNANVWAINWVWREHDHSSLATGGDWVADLGTAWLNDDTPTRIVRISDLNETGIRLERGLNAVVVGPGRADDTVAIPPKPVTDGNCWLLSYSDDSVYNPWDTEGNGTGVFSVPGVVDQIWVDFAFPSGLYQQVSGQAPGTRAIDVRVYYRKIGETVFATKDFTLSGLTRTFQQFTKIIDVPQGEYEVYTRRLTDAETETGSKVTVDTVRWVRLQGRQVAPELESLDLQYTLIRTRFTTSSTQTVSNNRRVNMRVERLLPDHNGGNPNTLVGTSTLRDAMLYTLIDQAGYSIDNIDVDALRDIHDDLVAIETEAANFHGSIDQTMTSDDQLLTLGSIARIAIYRRGQRIYFNRANSASTAQTLFNARNKLQVEQKSFVFAESSDPDAIIVRFRNAEDDWVEKSIQYPDNVTPFQPREINLLGVTSPSVAYRRAKFEWDKLILQRDTVTCEVTEEGLFLDPADVFAMTDALATDKPVEGEVIAVNGNEYTFDQSIPAGTYVSRLRDQFGAIVAHVEITIAADGPTQLIPEWGAVDMPPANSQVGLLFSMTPVSDADAELWVMAEFAPGDADTGTLSGARFVPAVYDADDPGLTVPATIKMKRT